MKKLFCALSVILALGCSHQKMMNQLTFSDVSVGMGSSDLIAKVGSPYSTVRKSDGTVEYEYIEKIKTSSRDLEQIHYVIILKKDQVVGKKMKRSFPPGYMYDSIDFQTSYSD